jgi:ABC-type transport system involved in multi-copper enzyme maturation permease subunit
MQTTWLIAASSMRQCARDRTVALLAAMFFVMILIAAYLGWSATGTVNAIYAKAALVFQAQGKPVPPNPVGETPPLSVFRNMVTYVALLGALAALVLGHQLVATDRKSGIVQLLFCRPIHRVGFAIGKISALVVTIIGILATSLLVNILTLLLMPGLALNADIWTGLLLFYAVSAIYMFAFGVLGAVCAARFKTESLALLLPITIWLTLTFIIPQVTSNISPMAALNPMSANIVPPTSNFFVITSSILGPLSIAEAYRFLASTYLSVMPGAGTSTTAGGALLSLIATNIALLGLFMLSVKNLDASRSDYRD